MALSLCFWHELFFRCCVHRLCWPVRLEIRQFSILGRYGNAVIGSLLAWWVLGPRTREMTQRLKATTMPEFFGKRYNSRALRIAAAAIIFVFLIPYTASVYNGLSRLFGMAFGLPYEWCVIGMAVVTCIYVVLGGYVASVWNDFIQGTIMLIGVIAVISRC